MTGTFPDRWTGGESTTGHLKTKNVFSGPKTGDAIDDRTCHMTGIRSDCVTRDRCDAYAVDRSCGWICSVTGISRMETGHEIRKS